jgi:peroxiredoxin
MQEFPDLQSIYEDYSHRGFQILAINPYDSQEVIADTREELGLTFQLLMDPGQVVADSLYHVTIYPTNILVDGSGEVLHVLGGTSYQELSSLLNELYGSGP